MSKSEQYPSLIQQGKNLFKFSAKIVENIQDRIFFGDQVNMLVSSEIYNKRKEICKNCPRYDLKQKRCMECGCYIPVKAKMMFEDCPLYKWDNEINPDDLE